MTGMFDGKTDSNKRKRPNDTPVKLKDDSRIFQKCHGSDKNQNKSCYFHKIKIKLLTNALYHYSVTIITPLSAGTFLFIYVQAPVFKKVKSYVPPRPTDLP